MMISSANGYATISIDSAATTNGIRGAARTLRVFFSLQHRGVGRAEMSDRKRPGRGTWWGGAGTQQCESLVPSAACSTVPGARLLALAWDGLERQLI
jgi:hypothetical protein